MPTIKWSQHPWAEPFTLRLALISGATIIADGEVRLEQETDSKVLVSGTLVAQANGSAGTWILYGANGVRMIGTCEEGMVDPRCVVDRAPLTVRIMLDANAPIAGSFMRAMRPEAS